MRQQQCQSSELQGDIDSEHSSMSSVEAQLKLVQILKALTLVVDSKVRIGGLEWVNIWCCVVVIVV